MSGNEEPVEGLQGFCDAIVRRHSVSAIFHIKCEGKRVGHVRSGFLMKFDQDFIWVTAGHVLKDIFDAVDQGCEVGLTTFVGGGTVEYPLPFGFKRERCFWHDEGCVDVGCVALTQDVGENLVKHGIVPIVPEGVGNRESEADFYVVLGTPVETVGVEKRKQGEYVTLAPLPIVLRRIEDRMCGEIQSQFAFDASNCEVSVGGEPIQSVVGMSGGLVVGVFHQENGWGYGGMAVQSAWKKSSRTLYATPLDVVAVFIEGYLLTAGFSAI